MLPRTVTVRSASVNIEVFTYNEDERKTHEYNKKGDVFMNKKMKLWVAGSVGVIMAGMMSVSVYALEEKDVIGTWYVNELSMGGNMTFHPESMGMEVTVDIKEGGQIEITTSNSGEEPEVDQAEWKIEDDKLLITNDGESKECEYADGKLTIDADGMTMIMGQEKEEYEPYVPGEPVENPAIEDFEGEWMCTLMEAFGMQMPVNADFTGFEMSMSVEDGKAEIILIESGEETKVELQGDVEGNALVLKAVTEDEAGTMFFSLDNMKFNLLDDGKLCLIAEDDAEESDDGEEADDAETGEDDFSVKTYFEKIIVTE